MDEEIYVSHKRVKRKAMTRQEYCDYRGWDVPDVENGSDEGYLVEYLDGGVSNDTRHDGYISWSPKEAFDNGYTKEEIEVSPAENTYQERVIIERQELSERLVSLNMFICNNPAFSKLNAEERELLRSQAQVMDEYCDILKERIEQFA